MLLNGAAYQNFQNVTNYLSRSHHNTLPQMLHINIQFMTLPLLASSSDNVCCALHSWLQLPTAELPWLYPHRSWPQSLPVRYQYSATVLSSSCLEFLQHYILSFNMLTDAPNLKPALRNTDMWTYWKCTYTIQTAESWRMFMRQVIQPSFQGIC